MNDIRKLDEAIEARWNANSGAWAQQIREGQDVYRTQFLEPEFMNFVGDIQGLDLLDGACGEGTSSRIMARAGAKVTAVDLSSEMIVNATALESAEPNGIQYHHASVANLPFPDARFDVVTSWMALSDMSCMGEALKDFARVTKPGGRLYFCIRHPCYFTSRQGVVRRTPTEDPFLLVSQYFRETPWSENWSFAGGKDESDGQKTFANLRFPMTMSDCINHVLAAGYLLHKVAEPRPSEALCQQLPRLRFWRHQAALYLFVAATKPI